MFTDHRPAVLPLDLLPRARRGAARNRHRPARIHRRRTADAVGPGVEATAVAGALPSRDRTRVAHPEDPRSRRGAGPRRHRRGRWHMSTREVEAFTHRFLPAHTAGALTLAVAARHRR